MPDPFVIHHPNPARVEWACAGTGCYEQAVTGPYSTQVPWHHCAGAGGVFVPLTKATELAKVTRLEREDYVAGDLVQTDDAGRPVMAVELERPDGSTDRVVYAPTATAAADEVEDARDG